MHTYTYIYIYEYIYIYIYTYIYSSYMHPESKPTHKGVGSHRGTPVPRSSARVAVGRMRKAFSRRPIPAKQEDGL